MHFGRCRQGSTSCYSCGQEWHGWRNCLTIGQGGTCQSTRSAVGSSSSAQSIGRGAHTSARRGRGRGREGESSFGSGKNRTYSLTSRQDSESSPDVVTGTLIVCSHCVYALIDPGSTLSYVTPFIAGKLCIVAESLDRPFIVSTPVGESIVARRVYRGCTVEIIDRQTSIDLVELEMVDFDVIMGMDWLASCYANVECRTKIVRFHFPGEAVREWKGDTAAPKGRFISYLKARRMITKGCIYHLVHVHNIDAEPPTLQSIPVVSEFLDVFPDELPGIPPEREIDFAIDMLPGTQPISIPPYRMAPAELK